MLNEWYRVHPRYNNHSDYRKDWCYFKIIEIIDDNSLYIENTYGHISSYTVRQLNLYTIPVCSLEKLFYNFYA